MWKCVLYDSIVTCKITIYKFVLYSCLYMIHASWWWKYFSPWAPFPCFSLDMNPSNRTAYELSFINNSVLFLFYCLSISIHMLQLAKKLHPDTNKNDPEAEKKFQEVTVAYEVCSCCYNEVPDVYFESSYRNLTDGWFIALLLVL